MEFLYKVTENNIDGWEGDNLQSHHYIISEVLMIQDEEEITREDVVENDDGVFSTYLTYTNLGEISKDEIKILKKFKIIKNKPYN